MATGKKMIRMSPSPAENESLFNQYSISFGGEIILPKPIFPNPNFIVAPFVWRSSNLQEVQKAKIAVDTLSQIVDQFAASTHPVTEIRDSASGAIMYELYGFQKAKALPQVNSITGTYLLNPYTLRDVSRIALAYRPELFQDFERSYDM